MLKLKMYGNEKLSLATFAQLDTKILNGEFHQPGSILEYFTDCAKIVSTRTI